ncbi:DUF4393 domain-containing protein [Clostridium sp. CCUG 7971]|uniref:DUF4393 domain-containing protein n=1 Tax=Clostridium sp. CCUG 7971 TaxID=2811414 RepID=UPI001ABB13D7|nr:DUF4393 domain-containing protein [Clostridium sp. CCUG 7971]MBO3443396.1 DUF4393 domain-containing protein [Clostridium sp. CCUG 7971]
MIPTKPIENTLEKPSQTFGNALDGVFKFVFSPVLKYQIKKEYELQNYKEQIYNNVSYIPQENLIDPPLNIVGPALEASKFYIDSDEIRNMFAKLISSSMDNRINNSAHSAFIEIIKQLSQLDAQIITKFIGCKTLPIAKLRSQDDFGHGVDLKLHILNDEIEKIDLISSSVSNLIRLGIVEVSYTNVFVDKNNYSEFNNHPILLEYRSFINSKEFEEHLAILKSSSDIFNKIPKKVVMVNGTITLTPFGEDFIKTCI